MQKFKLVMPQGRQHLAGDYFIFREGIHIRMQDAKGNSAQDLNLIMELSIQNKYPAKTRGGRNHWCTKARNMIRYKEGKL